MSRNLKIPSDYSLELSSSEVSGKPNLSSYPTSSVKHSVYSSSNIQGPGASVDEAVSLTFEDLDHVEKETNAKMKHSTAVQLVCRATVTFLSEFIASFFYYGFLLVGSVSGLSFEAIALLGWGLATVIPSVFVRENTGHLDPMITLALLAVGKLGLPFYFGAVYIVAQFCAIVLATLVAWGMTPNFEKSLGMGYEHLKEGFTPGQGFAAQLLGCFFQYSVFIWLVCAAGQKNFYEQTGSSYKRNSLFALAVGLAHLVANLAFGKIAGGNYGWYLHFFPGMISGEFDAPNSWLYVIAPPIAMAFVLGIYFFYKWVENMAYRTSHEKKNLKISKLKGK